MTPINNYDTYNSGMAKSYEDKLFFMEYIKNDKSVNSIVDYGCADGTMIKRMSERLSTINYYGYDTDPKMVNLANTEYFTADTDWKGIIGCIKPEHTLLNCSSVIHEVYSYGTRGEIAQFWNRVKFTGFKYIAIRDFSVSKSINRQVSPNDYKNLFTNSTYEQTKRIMDFEQIWGPIAQNKNLIHYLMKYRYVDNWEREVRENYFPVYLEDLLNTLLSDDLYEIVYSNHYILPFTKSKIEKDFNITLTDNTHVQILLKKKGDK
ncbi:Uncharacterised protein [uncultured Clostridium sp.]|nr:Uncharacterised protein [uncultured Clostridium sp.]